MVACGKQAGLSRLPLNRSASVSQSERIECIFFYCSNSFVCRIGRL
jgi:hypothetical protein